MRDFNAKMSQGRIEGCVEDYGLDDRNERGDRLIEFCQNRELLQTHFLNCPNADCIHESPLLITKEKQ